MTVSFVCLINSYLFFCVDLFIYFLHLKTPQKEVGFVEEEENDSKVQRAENSHYSQWKQTTEKYRFIQIYFPDN